MQVTYFTVQNNYQFRIPMKTESVQHEDDDSTMRGYLAVVQK